MREWKQTINFMPFWNEDGMSIVDKGKAAAAEIKRVFPDWENGDDDELEYIVGDFEEGVAEDEAPVEMFDSAMSDLYDWADENSVWVATNFK